MWQFQTNDARYRTVYRCKLKLRAKKSTLHLQFKLVLLVEVNIASCKIYLEIKWNRRFFGLVEFKYKLKLKIFSTTDRLPFPARSRSRCIGNLVNSHFWFIMTFLWFLGIGHGRIHYIWFSFFAIFSIIWIYFNISSF